MDWFNQNAAAIQAIATVVLVGVTIVYVWLTRSQANAAREQLELLRQDSQAARATALHDVGEIADELAGLVIRLQRRGDGDALEALYEAEESWNELVRRADVIGGEPAARARQVAHFLSEWRKIAYDTNEKRRGILLERARHEVVRLCP